MAGAYFGTDGMRGEVGTAPITPDRILALALAAGEWAKSDGTGEPVVVIGRDTRGSGEWIESVLCGGLLALGLDVVSLGTETTPGVAVETKSRGAVLGLVITASHNPYTDNGVKLFGADGFKLPDAAQASIEAAMDRPFPASAPAGKLGRRDAVCGSEAYDAAVDAVAAPGALKGLRLVVDCAQGAASRRAPRVFERLGAELTVICAEPDGTNINAGCGATHTEGLAGEVSRTGAHLGIAFDGDGDRLIMVDETGRTIDGDQLIALLARASQAEGRLKGGAVVATIMSNLGLERYLAGLGLGLERTQVGDRHVVERMRALGCNLGGEQSGHIVMLDHATTGDGLLAALDVLRIAAGAKAPFSSLASVFEPVAQTLINVRFEAGSDPLARSEVRDAIEAARAQLGSQGRLVVRASGTEPLIRIMAEATDPGEMTAAAEQVADAVRTAGG